MSIKETKTLLRTYRIVPNRLLGQNFTVEPSVFAKLVQYANLGKDDVVLEVGAGFGFLTIFLSEKCRSVVAVERDSRVADALRERFRHTSNVKVMLGDALKDSLPGFNKVVAIPPYYLSSRLLVWLLHQKVDCAVWVLQQEFANRLVASIGTESYSWLTVAARHRLKVELLDAVPKHFFFPQPEVDSVIVRLVPWSQTPFKVNDETLFLQMLRWLFTERNKKLCNALAPFIKTTRKVTTDEAKHIAASVGFRSRRVRTLSPADFGALANALTY
jgi:16S rRNA (adenine1518-N6/adenine1519-N6)-dimethyltransferase